jgi:hypothetical protein
MDVRMRFRRYAVGLAALLAATAVAVAVGATAGASSAPPGGGAGVADTSAPNPTEVPSQPAGAPPANA